MIFNGFLLHTYSYYSALELIDTSGDCNDMVAAINPGVSDLCDGLDNNCDGSIDEDFFYSENDIALAIGTDCGVGQCSSGSVICSDKNTATYSSLSFATLELCDHTDNCDGQIDEICVQLASDFDDDYDVDGVDLQKFTVAFNNLYLNADLNDDGDINILDISKFASDIGRMVDSDADGILDDGDLNNIDHDHLCTNGEIAYCDDNCPTVYNPWQEDLDGDGIGDACSSF